MYKEMSSRKDTVQTSFSSHYINVKGINFHYLDEGDKDWPVVLLLHGIPTWSYTFRNIIPILKNEKIRCIAPDLPGFGNTCCINRKAYSLQEYRDIMIAFMKQINIRTFYIYGNDWGALIALLILSDIRLHIKGVVVSNGYLPVIGQQIPMRFRLWMWFTRFSPLLPVSRIIDSGTNTRISRVSKIMFDAPFKYKPKTAIRKLPNILPVRRRHKEARFVDAVWQKLQQSNTPLLTIFSTDDPFTAEGDSILQKRIPGSAGEQHVKLIAKHFITEDAPQPLALNIAGFIRKYRHDI